MGDANQEPVARVGDVPPGRGLAVKVKGRAVALFNDGGRIFALEDCCTHARIPLSGGWVENGCACCPWHGAEFDLESGKALSLPATGKVATYVVRVEGDEIFVDIPAENGA
jgi:nitrite reductase/ring-hydroxylating ferredoxin subunit